MNRKKPQPDSEADGKWIQAFIFDLDGVITDTARAHARAWKQMFDDYLQTLGERRGTSYGSFDREKDYLRYVDGKPRYQGVSSFLQSRGIELDFGSPDDSPRRETVCGLGNRKNEIYRQFLESGGVEVYPDAVEFIRRLKSRNIKTAVVSSSKNCRRVLAAAKIEALFEARVDGEVSETLGLEGKPSPDIFLQAARRLNVPARRAVVVEDAIAGVEAGRRGGFGHVIGIDRAGRGRDLSEHGADSTAGDLSEVDPDSLPQRRNAAALPSALAQVEKIAGGRQGERPAVFLDYDGTLTPIVDQPGKADLSAQMRRTLLTLTERCTVAIVSGRDLKDVKQRVSIEGLHYAGSHGFEIDSPGQQRIQNRQGAEALPALDKAEERLRDLLAGIEGALVERKKFSIAVHYRRVASGQVGAVENAVNEVLEQRGELRKGRGKKVFELQPDVEWDKGRAVLWMMERLEPGAAGMRPIYIGDDVTDEDAFRVVQRRGAGIVVHGGERRPTFARYGLVDTGQVRMFLHKLSDAVDGGG